MGQSARGLLFTTLRHLLTVDALVRGAPGVVHLPAAVRGGETPARARHHPPRPQGRVRVRCVDDDDDDV